MGKVKARKRRLRRLSLKWSFFLYAAVAVLAALAAIMLLTAICSELQDGLYHRWETRYGAQYRIPAQLVVDGEVVGEQMAYSTSLFELVPEEEYARYTLYGRITLLSYPVVSVLSILIAGVLFYRRKLKRPLRQIEEAAGRIAKTTSISPSPRWKRATRWTGRLPPWRRCAPRSPPPAAISGACSSSGGRCRPPFPTICARR